MTDMTRKFEATMTEFEESVTFDADDPDFAPRGSERCLTIDSKTLDDNEKRKLTWTNWLNACNRKKKNKKFTSTQTNFLFQQSKHIN